MQELATHPGDDAAGVDALRQSLLRAFARPGGSIDLPLRDLAILLVTVQRPGLDLGGLADETGMQREGLRRVVDRLRRGGLLVHQAGADRTAMTLVPSGQGRKIVQDMAQGFTDVAVPDHRRRRGVPVAEGMGFEPTIEVDPL